jgi:FAD/FMN-containing dehydrogenase
MAEWKNWSGTVEHKNLERKYRPENEQEFLASVLDAYTNKWKLRVVGSGHSWSNLGAPANRGAVICMSEMAPVHNFVRGLGNGEAIVEVGGGLTIEKMNEWLDSQGWALFNMGDANPQIVVGAISTETHGSGVKRDPDSVGSLSEYVEGMKIVRCVERNGRPEVETYELTEDELAAGRVSLGRLGAILSVRLRVRRRYFLQHSQKLVKFDKASEGAAVEGLLQDKTVRHFEYWHYPHTDQAEKIVRRITDSTEILNPLRLDQEWFIRLFSRSFANIGALDARRIPDIVNRAMNDPFQRKTFEVERQGPWHQILLGKSNVWRKAVKTYTMEYQLPYENLWPAFDDYLDSIQKAKKDWEVYAAPPTQVRFSQRSERSLLTHLRHSPTVSFSVSFFRNHRGVHTWLPDLERRFIKHGGKPHWGKMYYVAPEADDNMRKFEEIRRKLDPSGTFSFVQGPYTPDAEAFQSF